MLMDWLNLAMSPACSLLVCHLRTWSCFYHYVWLYMRSLSTSPLWQSCVQKIRTNIFCSLSKRQTNSYACRLHHLLLIERFETTVKPLVQDALHPKLKYFSSGLAVVVILSTEARFQFENEEEWSIILLSVRVSIVLEVWRYVYGIW